MKLLILTQKIDKNDDLLGFFHGWLAEFAKHFEKITAVALGVGEYHLPANVKILSLGKEQGASRMKYLARFYGYIWRERKNYDAVFVHMNQEYAILGGWLWRLLGKKTALWRNHPNGNLGADLAVRLSDVVFCTSGSAYVARFKKTRLMPVGVDTNFFKPEPAAEKIPGSLLFFGRLSPIKKPDLLIEALNVLKEKNINFSAKIIGNAPERDLKYAQTLKRKVEEGGLGDSVKFEEGVPAWRAAAIFNRHEIFVNLTPSGSYDKTIFEAMACGALILASNDNLRDILPPALANLLVFKEGDAVDLADKIFGLLSLPPGESAAIKRQLRQIVEQRQSLNLLAEKLTEQFK